MSEPTLNRDDDDYATIDEMITWAEHEYFVDRLPIQLSVIRVLKEYRDAIRAILEQHQKDKMSDPKGFVYIPLVNEPLSLEEVNRRETTATGAILERHRRQLSRDIQIQAIRAFVERVEKLKGQSGEGRFGYRQRVYAELAAMEGEANAGTNDR